MASFGKPGTRNRIWCTTCKEDDAISFTEFKPCQCGKHSPSFGFEDDGKLIWCSKCPEKPENAINLKEINRKCQCGKHRPCFGEIDCKAEYCAECKTKTAVNVVSFLCPCGIIPSFSLEDGISKWCSQCPDKPENAINLKSKNCFCGKHSSSFGLEGGKCSEIIYPNRLASNAPNALQNRNVKLDTIILFVSLFTMKSRRKTSKRKTRSTRKKKKSLCRSCQYGGRCDPNTIRFQSDVEILTQEPFAELDMNDLVELNERCYDKRTLLDWLKQKPIDPSTREVVDAAFIQELRQDLGDIAPVRRLM